MYFILSEVNPQMFSLNSSIQKYQKMVVLKPTIEPFSGSMGTYMDDPNLKFDVVVYNDKNRHQANLYKCCC
jgi:hypothetical protein